MIVSQPADIHTDRKLTFTSVVGVDKAGHRASSSLDGNSRQDGVVP